MIIKLETNPIIHWLSFLDIRKEYQGDFVSALEEEFKLSKESGGLNSDRRDRVRGRRERKREKRSAKTADQLGNDLHLRSDPQRRPLF